MYETTCYLLNNSPKAVLTIVAGDSISIHEYSNLFNIINDKVNIDLLVNVVASMQDLEESHNLQTDLLLPHYIFGNIISVLTKVHSLKANYAVQKKVFSQPAHWAGIITFGSCLLPEFREQMHLVSLMCINGENDGLFRPLRSAESFFHVLKYSRNRTSMFLNHPVMYLEGINHKSVLNSQSSKNKNWNQDLYSKLPKSEGYDIISTLVVAFIEREISENAATLIIRTALESEKRILPMLDLLHLEANIRLNPPCDSDKPSPHCPFYPMYPMV